MYMCMCIYIYRERDIERREILVNHGYVLCSVQLYSTMIYNII